MEQASGQMESNPLLSRIATVAVSLLVRPPEDNTEMRTHRSHRTHRTHRTETRLSTLTNYDFVPMNIH